MQNGHTDAYGQANCEAIVVAREEARRRTSCCARRVRCDNRLLVRRMRFFFFSNEGNEPPHIHIEDGDGYAKFWLDPRVSSFQRTQGGHPPASAGAHATIHRRVSEAME